MTDRERALAQVAAIVEHGGDADDVLREALAVLVDNGIASASIRFVEGGALVDGPSAGAPAGGERTVPVLYDGERVGELTLTVDDPAFAERVADLLGPYVLVGWDTAGEPWSP